jgi:hypothetical protein
LTTTVAVRSLAKAEHLKPITARDGLRVHQFSTVCLAQGLATALPEGKGFVLDVLRWDEPMPSAHVAGGTRDLVVCGITPAAADNDQNSRVFSVGGLGTPPEEPSIDETLRILDQRSTRCAEDLRAVIPSTLETGTCAPNAPRNEKGADSHSAPSGLRALFSTT